MRTFIIFSIFIILFLAGFANAAAVSTDTYAIANQDQANFTDAIYYQGNVYFLMSSAIYQFNLTTKQIKKVFDAGFNYILSSIIHAYDGSFYVAGYKLYNTTSNDSSGGGGGGNHIYPVSWHPVVTCPLPEQDYILANFTVWRLSDWFNVEGSAVLNMNFSATPYFWALRAMKIFETGTTDSSQIYAVLMSDEYSDATSYVYKLDESNGMQLVKVFSIPETLVDAAYYGGTLYLLHHNDTSNELLAYDITGNKLGSYTESTFSFAMFSVYADANYIYLAGADATQSTDWKGVVEVLDHSFADVYFGKFTSISSFYSVFGTGRYVVTAAYNRTAQESILYAINFTANKISYEYVNYLQSVYDLKTESNISVIDKNPYALKVVAWSEGNSTYFAWGGYFTTSDNYMRAWMVMTEKPAGIMINPGGHSGGGGSYTPTYLPDFSEIWEKYKYEIITVGVLLVLMMLGGRRE